MKLPSVISIACSLDEEGLVNTRTQILGHHNDSGAITLLMLATVELADEGKFSDSKMLTMFRRILTETRESN